MVPQSSPEWIEPTWGAPASVRALVTTRNGGVSGGPYTSLNLGDHVGDDPAAVAENRSHLRRCVALPAEPRWLSQVHGCAVADDEQFTPGCEADAAYSRRAGEVLAVLTADCLPVLFCSDEGDEVAVAHAGWRGLADGVLEATLARFHCPTQKIHAWLGPAIGPTAFEVGAEVREVFVKRMAEANDAFAPGGCDGHYLADLYLLARQRLQAAGVERIGGGGFCTYSDPERFYSYRRDGVTGRMATLIYIAN